MESARDTNIIIEHGEFQRGEWRRHLPKQIAFVTDYNLTSRYEKSIKELLNDHFDMHYLSIPPGEKSKTRRWKTYLEDRMIERGLGRNCGVVAFGGGVICDLAGFLAATYCRGVPFFSIPTSFLAMVDASIGGKVGVNTRYGKNLIGTFYSPRTILIDPQLLSSLPGAEWQNGIAEVIKYSLVASADLFHFLVERTEEWGTRNPELIATLIEKSVQIKQSIVAQDPREVTGLRRILNFGHTVGHALECASNYQMSHGEAIAIGMGIEARLSHKIGCLSKDELERIERLFSLYKFSRKIDGRVPEKELKKALQRDKKGTTGKPRFVALKRIGEVVPFDGEYCTVMDLENALA